jgi:hypothetical protein
VVKSIVRGSWPRSAPASSCLSLFKNVFLIFIFWKEKAHHGHIYEVIGVTVTIVVMMTIVSAANRMMKAEEAVQDVFVCLYIVG